MKKSNFRLKSVLFWVFAFLIMLSISVYQRMTGPTKPMRGKISLNESKISYSLLRTWGDDSNAEIRIDVPDEKIKGKYIYKRYKSYDEWDTLSMRRNGNELFASLPQLPPAGKMMYHIILMNDQEEKLLNSEPAVLRYKGHVPDVILIPHIILMFLAMLFSLRTGFEALFMRRSTFKLALLTLLFLVAGGLILGPLVQKYAFDAYWTGWPIGNDLTDNKTGLAFIFWLIAVLVLRKKRSNILWPVLASAVLLAVYMIPHSVLGSEIDYTKEADIEMIENNDR
jgi:hypothetical protein